MKQLTVNEIKSRFLNYFSVAGKHTIIEGASLVPAGDNSVLFTTAGMHPIMNALAGIAVHPSGNRLVNVQKVVRTGAINNVGIGSCLTFFELLGNWIIDYSDKNEIIQYVWDFLTSDKGLEINPSCFRITCFSGNSDLPRDEGVYKKWLELGVEPQNIFWLNSNIKGPYGENGLYGTNTKVYYDTGKPECTSSCKPSCGCGKYIELWDIVFFDYSLKDNVITPAKVKSIDTGAGVERLACLLQEKQSVYETDIFQQITGAVETFCEIKMNMSESTLQSYRIFADHLRCAVFILGDSVETLPGSKGRNYVLRKILRRMFEHGKKIKFEFSNINDAVRVVTDIYINYYPELTQKKAKIVRVISDEYDKYDNTIRKNLVIVRKMLKKENEINEELLSRIYSTYGIGAELVLSEICNALA